MVPRLLALAVLALAGGLAGARFAADDEEPLRNAAPSPPGPTVRTTAPAPTETHAAVAAPRPRTRPTATRPRAPVPTTTTTAPAPTAPAPTAPAFERVPAVVGLREAVAAAALARSSLSAVVRPQAVADRSGDGVVLRQFPAPGLRVLRGTPVTLVVGRYQAP